MNTNYTQSFSALPLIREQAQLHTTTEELVFDEVEIPQRLINEATSLINQLNPNSKKRSFSQILRDSVSHPLVRQHRIVLPNTSSD